MPGQPRPKIKYQFFVSSTYQDLREERNIVIWEVLKSKHIPVGMEIFPSSDDRGWKIIQRTIDDSDYYILLLGGRYGSVGDDGISWTEKEYDYARSKGMKVIAFMRDFDVVPQGAGESDAQLREKIINFRKKVSSNHHRQIWQDKQELQGMAMHAIRSQIDVDTEEEELPRGWIRGDQAGVSQAVTEELALLSAENRDLREQLKQLTEDAGTLEVHVNGSKLDLDDGNVIRHTGTIYQLEEEPRPSRSRSQKSEYSGLDFLSHGLSISADTVSKIDNSGAVNKALSERGRTLWIDVDIVNSGRKPVRGMSPNSN